MSIIEGFVIGVSMIIFIGPVFFLLLNSSLQSGTKAGMAVALGIITSDIICILLCYYGLISFLNTENHKFWIGVLGSILVFSLGINYLFKKGKANTTSYTGIKGLLTFFIKGFSVNFFNPFVFIVWIGVCNYGQNKYGNEKSFIWYLIFVLVGILTTDLLKVFLSKQVKKFISPYRLSLLFKCSGVLLIIFSVRILYLVC